MTQMTLDPLRRAKTARPWLVAALCTVSVVIQFVFWLSTQHAPIQSRDWMDALAWNLALPVVFAFLAAVVLTRQPGNRVGWLMMIPALSAAILLDFLSENQPASPETLTFGLWLITWLGGWSWMPLIFTVLLIPLNFPDGRPPTRRWEWVNRLAAGMWLTFMLVTAFQDQYTSSAQGWTLPNPIGFIPGDLWEGPFMVVWVTGLAVVTLSSVAALFTRYRRARPTEREQIKWLLSAVALFALIYILGLIFIPQEKDGYSFWSDLALVSSILTIPVAITIAIVRYRLWDIDVIIRKTLVYTVVTALLALVYFGSVVLLQGLFSPSGGERSPAAIVLSTLAIAALFNPLRRRVQDAVDRRFYRSKYDAGQTLETFAAIARNEVELEQLSTALVQSVETAVQPERVSLWLVDQAERVR